jgi:hypothetical protein
VLLKVDWIYTLPMGTGPLSRRLALGVLAINFTSPDYFHINSIFA